MGLFLLPFRPAYDSNMKVVAGAKAWFTLAGTNTPSAPYEEETLSTAHTNPVIANGVGRWPTIWLDPEVSYRVRIYDADAVVGTDTPIEEYDPYDANILVENAISDAESVSPVDFGAVGDGETDDYDAFEAAIDFLPERGGELRIPVGVFYLSQTLNITKPIKIVGMGTGQNPGVVGATSYPFPDYFHGSTLLFAANIPGIVFHTYNTGELYSVVSALPMAERFAEQSSHHSTMRDLNIASNAAVDTLGGIPVAAADADANGVIVRTRVFFDNLWISRFGGHGLLVSASAGADDALLGNASLATFRNVASWQNGGDGFNVVGRDANVMLFDCCDSSYNGGWGYYDGSLTGNTYNTCQTNINNKRLAASATANIGSWKVTGGVNATKILGCYGEAAGGYISDLAQTVTVEGGQYSSEVFHPENCPATVISAGLAFRRAYRAKNELGDATVNSGIGRDETGSAANVALWFGSTDQSALSDQYKFVYNLAGKRWEQRYSTTPIAEWPAGGANWRTTTVFAPSYPNGIFLGSAGAGPRIFYGTAAPVAGDWQRGDMVINSNAAVGAPAFWQCVTSGAPGTWAASANLV